jgi:hypothetical protein
VREGIVIMLTEVEVEGNMFPFLDILEVRFCVGIGLLMPRLSLGTSDHSGSCIDTLLRANKRLSLIDAFPTHWSLMIVMRNDETR